MSREIGPREHALRNMREANQIRAQLPLERQAKIAKRATELIAAVAVASKKRGKTRKK